MKQDTCTTCYQIKCQQCDWIALNEEVEKIQKGEMTACPVCGWKPGEKIQD